jgi:hypothetical protein
VVNARLITSFAINPRVPDETGVWMPGQARKLLAYTNVVEGRDRSGGVLQQADDTGIWRYFGGL